jgi:hypothetical protein
VIREPIGREAFKPGWLIRDARRASERLKQWGGVTMTNDLESRLRRLCDPMAEAMPDGPRLTELVHAGIEAADRIRELEAVVSQRESECFAYEMRLRELEAALVARAALNTQTGQVDPAPSSSGPAPTATVNRR